MLPTNPIPVNNPYSGIPANATGLEAMIRAIYSSEIAAIPEDGAFILTVAILEADGSYGITVGNTNPDAVSAQDFAWHELAEQIELRGANPNKGFVRLNMNVAPNPETGWLRQSAAH